MLVYVMYVVVSGVGYVIKFGYFVFCVIGMVIWYKFIVFFIVLKVVKIVVFMGKMWGVLCRFICSLY